MLLVADLAKTSWEVPCGKKLLHFMILLFLTLDLADNVHFYFPSILPRNALFRVLLREHVLLTDPVPAGVAGAVLQSPPSLIN